MTFSAADLTNSDNSTPILTPELLRETLQNLAEPAYREFHLRTCPEAKHLLGVRIPEQRKLAKTIIKTGNYWQYLDGFKPYYYEEAMILGLIIATAPLDVQERLNYTAWFLPYIDNWAICDTFCNSFKIKNTDREAYWQFLLQFQNSDAEFTLRFVIVMLLDHFISEQYLTDIFALLDHITSSAHYVEMAKAWLIAEIFTEFPDQVFDYLSRDQLSTFAHNKAIQKACESRRVSAEQKQHLRALKL